MANEKFYIVAADALPEGFLCADAILRLCQNVASGLRVNETVVDRTLREYLPFMATENIMMDAVKRGADRQELHERIRVHSMAASRVVKEEGGENDLLERIAADPIFGVTMEELEEIMLPEKYVGRAPQQTEDFLNHEVANALQKYEDLKVEQAEINV